MKNLNITFFIILCAPTILSGCTTSYAAPTISNNIQSLTTISNYNERKGVFDNRGVTITSIDKKSVTYWIRDSDQPIPITAGEHSFDLVASYTSHLIAYNSHGTIDANFKTGVAYRLKMKVEVEKNEIGVWIEDSFGKVITPIKWMSSRAQLSIRNT